MATAAVAAADGRHHPTYLFKPARGPALELHLQPRADHDYGLRTESISCHDASGDCGDKSLVVTDTDGQPIHWEHNVGHHDWLSFTYPFKVSAECQNGHTETLITHDSYEEIHARPIAVPLHEDLEIRLASMIGEAHAIMEEFCGPEHERRALEKEVLDTLAEDFSDQDVDDMTEGSFFRYFVAVCEHNGIRVMLKFSHIVDYDDEDVAHSFTLKFRAAKILVPYGSEFESFFKHEHSLGSLVTQNHIMHKCLSEAYRIGEQMIEDSVPVRVDRDGESDDNEPQTATGAGPRDEQRIGASITKAVKKAAKSVGSAFSKAGKATGKAAKSVARRTASVARSAGRRAVSAGRTVGTAASSAAGRLKRGATSAATRIRTAASSAAGKIRTATSSAATKIKLATVNAAGRVKTAASSAATSVKSTATRVKESAVKRATSVRDTVKAKATQAREAVGKRFESVKTSVTGARDKIKDRVSTAKQAVRDKVKSLRGSKSASIGHPPKSVVGVPQDKVTPATVSSGQTHAVGAGTSGDARAPQGITDAQRQKQMPKPPSKQAQGKQLPESQRKELPAKPAAKQGSGSGASKPPPRRHDQTGTRPTGSGQPTSFHDDSLDKYNVPPPAASAGGPAAASSHSSTVTTSTGGQTHVSSSSTTTSGGGMAHTSTVTSGSGGTVVSHTATSSSHQGFPQQPAPQPTHTQQQQAAPAASSRPAKQPKAPKEPKQGRLSKLKDKLSSQSQGKSSSGSKGDGDSGTTSGGSDSGGSGGAAGGSGSYDTSATRPDYDRMDRDAARQQRLDDYSQQSRQDVSPYDFRGRPGRADGDQLAGAVAAGALTGAVVGSMAARPGVVTAAPGVYGAPPPIQSLPPGYAMTANGVMAIGADGRVYPLTPEQAASLQAYQQQQQGLVPPGGMPPAPQGVGSSSVSSATQGQQQQAGSPGQPGQVTSFQPSFSVRPLADDDVTGPGSEAETVKDELQDDDDGFHLISAELTEAQDAERRDAVYKYLVAEHGATFGKTPTKIQKDKLKARINAVRPFVIVKILQAYVEWLVQDTGLRYA